MKTGAFHLDQRALTLRVAHGIARLSSAVLLMTLAANTAQSKPPTASVGQVAQVTSCGGGPSTGGSYSLNTSSGQVCLGSAASAAYGLESGFWRNVSTPLVAGVIAPGTITNNSASLAVAALLATFQNPEGDALSLLSVDGTSAMGGTVIVSNGQVIYTAPVPLNSADSFFIRAVDANGNVASAKVSLFIAANIVLSPLLQIYDGAPKAVMATTQPAGLNVAITYDGSSAIPTAAGSYIVVGSIQDANYTGSATNVLWVIARPEVQVAQNTSGDVWLQWTTMSGPSYQLQYTTNLLSNVWMDAGSPIAGTGTSLSVSNVVVTEDVQRFFRIRVSAP